MKELKQEFLKKFVIASLTWHSKEEEQTLQESTEDLWNWIVEKFPKYLEVVSPLTSNEDSELSGFINGFLIGYKSAKFELGGKK